MSHKKEHSTGVSLWNIFLKRNVPNSQTQCPVTMSNNNTPGIAALCGPARYFLLDTISWVGKKEATMTIIWAQC